jgi:PAS domain S-box-containing protein
MMDWPYEYNPYLWPFFASAVFLAAMMFYAYRDRTVPGAFSFILLLSGIMLQVLASALGLAGTNDATRIFWFKFESALLLPIVSAALCFALEYTGLGKWVNPQALFSLAVFPFVYLLLILTNDAHHWVWRRIWYDHMVYIEKGPAFWGAFFYGYFLTLLHLIVLAWLFVRSPRHRWIAFWLILSPFMIRATYFLKIINWNLIAPLDPMLVVLNFALLPYALAIFRFHMFDVAPVVRHMVMERMADGMMVLDIKNRLADINNAAQEVLEIAKSKVVGRKSTEFLQDYPELLDFVGDPEKRGCEVISWEAHSRWYRISISPLIDQRGFHLGRLFLFHDITEQRRSEAEILDYQRTLAMLREREILGRELHDGIGQMLAAAHLQGKAGLALLARGEIVPAQSCLNQIVDLTQKAKESVRDYLLGVKTVSSNDLGFLSKLRQYLTIYSNNYGIHTELIIPPELEELRLDSAIEAQLQPIIQEALVNVRRHSESLSVRLAFSLSDGQLRILVEDEGKGFDANEIGDNLGFGFRSMRGRAEAIGANFEIKSSSGSGTQIIIHVPWRKEDA